MTYRPCVGCKDRPTCTEICYLLEAELPNMHLGRGVPRGRPLVGTEAVRRLTLDGMLPDEIGYHVNLPQMFIERLWGLYQAEMGGKKR